MKQKYRNKQKQSTIHQQKNWIKKQKKALIQREQHLLNKQKQLINNCKEVLNSSNTIINSVEDLDLGEELLRQGKLSITDAMKFARLSIKDLINQLDIHEPIPSDSPDTPDNNEDYSKVQVY